jgi:hypothetical protein
MQMPLAPYKGQMGSGQISATKLLAAIDDKATGADAHFPNLTIKVGAELEVCPANYFKGGESLTYVVEIKDNSIATCEVVGANFRFKGLMSGATTATITASNGEVHSFNITVRKSSGWL